MLKFQSGGRSGKTESLLSRWTEQMLRVGVLCRTQAHSLVDFAPLPSHTCPRWTMYVETKFLRLGRAVRCGDDIDGWRLCWLGGWDKHRKLFVVMVQRVRRDAKAPPLLLNCVSRSRRSVCEPASARPIRAPSGLGIFVPRLTTKSVTKKSRKVLAHGRIRAESGEMMMLLTWGQTRPARIRVLRIKA
jgi:hypothetical protein